LPRSIRRLWICYKPSWIKPGGIFRRIGGHLRLETARLKPSCAPRLRGSVSRLD